MTIAKFFCGIGCLLFVFLGIFIGLGMPRDDGISMSDSMEFRELCLPEYQREIDNFSGLATDVKAFIFFINSRRKSTQQLFISGRLKNRPQDKEGMPEFIEIGDYLLLRSLDDRDMPRISASAFSILSSKERSVWEKRWEKRGRFYCLHNPKGHCGSFWIDEETNFVIAYFQ